MPQKEQYRFLTVNNREIAGGSSSYEVINQYSSTIERSGGSRNRRFDITLLINGFPLIHIELKNHDHPYMDAFRQIKKILWGRQIPRTLGPCTNVCGDKRLSNALYCCQ